MSRARKEFRERFPRAWSWARRLAAPIRRRRFEGSSAYWERRYRAGGTSGQGSYGVLAEFKAEVLNAFVVDRSVSSVVEFGSGDGHQLQLAAYPRYLGIDVSRSAIERCQRLFRDDPTKTFLLYDPQLFDDPAGFIHADLALSLDVIFHLVEDTTFERYMSALFRAADRFVIMYSSDVDQRTPGPHERHRKFSTWVARNAPEWGLVKTLGNVLPI